MAFQKKSTYFWYCSFFLYLCAQINRTSNGIRKSFLNEGCPTEKRVEKEEVLLCLHCKRPFEERHECEICNGLCFEKIYN